MNKAFRSYPVVEYTTENEMKIQVLPQKACCYAIVSLDETKKF